MYVNVDSHQKLWRRTTHILISKGAVKTMVQDTISQLEHATGKGIGNLSSCVYIHTRKRVTSRDNYSSYKVALLPTHSTLTNNEVNNIIEIVDTNYSCLWQDQLHIKDKENNFKPYSDSSWVKFTSIQLPCVNNTSDISFGLIMSLDLLIHGQHHKIYKWIMYELYHTIIEYLPDDFEGDSILEFRSIFRVRAGNFTAKQSNVVSIPLTFNFHRKCKCANAGHTRLRHRKTCST